MICDYLDMVDPATPMEQICDGMVDCYINDTLHNPALVNLQRSLIIYPELQQAYRATSHDISRAIAPHLERWGIHMTEEQRSLTMLCLGEVSTALQDFALSRDTTYDPAVIDEMKLIFRAYYQARATAKSV